MKRLTAWLLILIMLMSGMSACAKRKAVPTVSPAGNVNALPTAEPQASASELLAQLDKDFFMDYVTTDLSTLQQFIKRPAELGIDINEVEITFGSFSKEEDDENLEWYRELMDRLKAIDRSALTKQEQMTYDCMERDFVQTIESGKYYGCYEPLRAYVGLQTDIPLEFWFFEVNNKWDAEAYLTLLADVPRFYQDLLAYEQYRSSIGLFMTEEQLDTVLKDLDDILKVRDSIFLIKTYNDAVDALTDLTPEEAASLKERNLSLLTNEFYQAHLDLKNGLEALRATCREPLGAAISGNKLYKDYYVETLISSCNDNKTIDEISEILLDQMNRSLAEARAAYQKVPSAIDPFSAKITEGSLENNIAYLHKILDPLLPEIQPINVTYKNVPEELSEMLSPAAYLNPSFDDWQNNLIILNKPEEDKTLLCTLAHEGFNGHLYQFMYHRSMEGLSWTQQLLETTCYAEAWSQESERLLALNATGSKDSNLLMTVHAFDQYSLMLYAYSAVMINGYEVTLDDYIRYIESLGYDAQTAKEIYQFSVDNPFYYMNYAYSYARLQNIYNSAQKKLGSAFDEKEFFKTYLDCGPAPFDLIEDRINEWIASR